MRKPLFTGALLTLLAGFPLSGHAAEWQIDPSLTLVGSYNDNVRLSADNKIESWIGTLRPSVDFRVTTPTSGASGELLLDFERYEADSDLNENKVRFDTRAYHTMERSRIDIDLRLVDDTTLDSQLDETGLVFDRVPRRRYDINPSWTWLLSPRSRLSASYTYSNTEYEDAAGTGFVDYTLNAGQISLSRVLSERAQASTSLSYTASSNENDVDSRNTGLQAGGSYAFSETLTTSLFIGVRYTEVDYDQTSLVPVIVGNSIIGVPVTQAISKSSWGSTFNAGLTKSFERGETTLSASRRISNQINGQPLEVNQIRWNSQYRFSETVRSELALAFYNTRSETLAGQQLDRNYYSVEPRLRWQFAEFWSVSALYRYRVQLSDNSDDDAIQNAAYLTLTYHWPRMAISR